MSPFLPVIGAAVVIGLLVIATHASAAVEAEGLVARSLGWSITTPPAEFAQDPVTPKGSALPALAATAHSEQAPSPAQTMCVFNTVEPWIRAWSVPAEDQPAANTGADGQPLEPQWGVCINLRLHGQLIGRGVAMVAPDSAEPSPHLIARAAAAAIRAADGRLPVPNDLMRDESIKQLTPDIQISLELAGAPIPVNADTWALIDTTLAPGLDGIVVRVAEGEPRAEFPSVMMMGNNLPQKSIRALMASAIGEGGAAAVLDQPRDLREKHAVNAWRFRVSHLAQCAAGKGPEFLYRGARLVTGTPAHEDLRRFAGSLAGNLIRRTDFGPAESRALSSALGAYALTRYGRWRRADPIPPQTWLPSGSEAARRLYCDAYPTAAAHEEPALAALLMLSAPAALSEPCVAETITNTPVWLPEPVVRHAIGLDERMSEMPPATRALLGLAVVPQVLIATSPPQETDATINMVERSLRAINAANMVSAMPWYGWSHVRLERFRREIEAGKRGLDRRPMFADLDRQLPPGELPAAAGLREMRTEVWKHQLDALDAGTDGADMVGGIVFTAGNTSPLPTWQCVRPLAFLATMLGDDRLTEPHERALELAHLLHAFRFLRQLQVDDSCGWMYPNPEAAIGGMRAATWDHTMPPDATSLTLLAVVELLKSMDKIAPEMAKDPAK